MRVLVADIGGTKTILAVYSNEQGCHAPLMKKTYSSQAYPTFEAMVEEFLAETRTPVDCACLGVAGPVVLGTARLTNLGWFIDALKLQSAFAWSAVHLLNDMQAVGYSIPVLTSEQVYTLSPGKPVPQGAIAVLAPGTGLGEGFLTWDGKGYRAHPSEGSHAAFAPVGEVQIGLLRYMNELGYEHVSFERVCSGGLGIPHLYAYLKSTGLEEPAWLANRLAEVADPTPLILEVALDPGRSCELTTATLELFVSILGAEAGNLALKVLATGGIYLAGGISPRILEQLKKPLFLEALRNKGRFRQTLTDMPVHVILDPEAGLLGAAAYGLRVAAAC